MKANIHPLVPCLLLATAPAFAIEVEEIVITSTHRASAVSELAGNIAIVNDVEFVSASHISDALNRLPGVNIQHGSGQEHLTSIRSPVLTGGAGAGSFLYMEDGISLRSPGFANVNGLFEAHTEQAGRIEVVRGPGSALYGSNAVHGLVNVLSMNPATMDGSQISYDYGSHDQMSARLAAHFPGETANGLFNLTLKHDGGYRADNGYDEQKATLRSDWESGENRFTFLASVSNLTQETAGFIQGECAYKDDTLASSNPNPEAFRDARAIRSYLRWDRDVGNGMSLTITPYFRKTDMTFLMHFLPGQALEDNGHKSFGVQSRVYKEFGDGHLLIAGVDAEYTQGFLSEVQDGPTVFSFVTGTHYDYEITAVLVSPYVHGEWALGDDTRVTAGLRVDFTDYDYDNLTDADTVGRFQRAPDRSDDFVTATPKLGITHQLTDQYSLFGLYARGQRAPQTTDLYRMHMNQTPGAADPEIMDSIEFGVRRASDRLRFELTGYYMKKENFFFRDANGFNVEDGETEHAGVELGFDADLHETVTLSGSLSYARHTYAFDKTDTSENIRDGNDVDTAPKFLANIRLGWSPLEDLQTELEWVHMDEYYVDSANDHTYEGHDLFNLRASLKLNELVTLNGRIMNLFDEAYADRADFAFGNYRYFPGDERFYSIGFSLNF